MSSTLKDHARCYPTMSRLVGSAVLACVVQVRAAAADPPMASPVPGSDARLWIGGEADLLPVGNLYPAAGCANPATSTCISGTNTAVALGALLDYSVLPWLTLGVAPRFVFGVQAGGTSASSNQLDLRIRVTAGGQVLPGLRLYGISAVGYSIIFDSEVFDLATCTNSQQSADGVIWSVGAGASYALRPHLRITGEISYQLGYQSTTATTSGDDLLTLGVGLMTSID